MKSEFVTNVMKVHIRIPIAVHDRKRLPEDSRNDLIKSVFDLCSICDFVNRRSILVNEAGQECPATPQRAAG